MGFLLCVPCTIIRSLMVVAWLTDSGSLLVRRCVICDLIHEGVVVGMGLLEFAVTCNLEWAGGFGVSFEKRMVVTLKNYVVYC
jgi:hypothetical protein